MLTAESLTIREHQLPRSADMRAGQEGALCTQLPSCKGGHPATQSSPYDNSQQHDQLQLIMRVTRESISPYLPAPAGVEEKEAI